MGADTKASTRELVREVGGLLERLQRRVALEALRESGSSFGAELVASQTEHGGVEAGAEACQQRAGAMVPQRQRRLCSLC